MGVSLVRRKPAKTERRQAALARDFQFHLRHLFCNSTQRADAEPHDVRIVAAAQAAIGRQDQQDAALGFFAALQQRVADFQAAIGQIGHQLRDALRIGRGGVARSIAFLNRAVAINSIVRVILRMLRIDLRRLSRPGLWPYEPLALDQFMLRSQELSWL